MDLMPFMTFFAVIGPVFFPGVPLALRHVVDRIRHRNSDRDELARLLGGAQ